MEKVRNLSLEDLGISIEPPRSMTSQEEATLIAALRLWQNIQDGRLTLHVGKENRVLSPVGSQVGLNHFEDIATNLGEFAAIDIDGVDMLLSEVFGVD